MYLQPLLIRAAIAATTGLMLAAGIFIERSGHAAGPAVPASTVAESATRAMPEPVTLPTIHVRPTAADLAAASVPPKNPTRLATVVTLPDLPAAVSAPLHGLNIDMPYYSFGKVLPRVGSKE